MRYHYTGSLELCLILLDDYTITGDLEVLQTYGSLDALFNSIRHKTSYLFRHSGHCDGAAVLSRAFSEHQQQHRQDRHVSSAVARDVAVSRPIKPVRALSINLSIHLIYLAARSV